MAVISRRGLFRIASGSLAAGGARTPLAAQPAASPDGIDLLTIKRRGVGFRGIDKAKAYPGLHVSPVLIAATNLGTVYLIDMEGKVVHRWEMPYSRGLHGDPTERGTLFYNGKIPMSTHQNALHGRLGDGGGLERQGAVERKEASGAPPRRRPPQERQCHAHLRQRIVAGDRAAGAWRARRLGI